MSHDALRADLERHISGEVRFDTVSRALYSTDASVYQIQPAGVVIPRTREDVVHAVTLAARHGVSITARGGGTSQAGQAIGAGVLIDTSKYLNRVHEVNVTERWARIEPGVVLDELNAQLKPHGLRFAPDISTASRATVGGMIANNSSGARSVLYGKTIDHVLELDVVLADGSTAHFRPLSGPELDAACTGDTLEASCYRTVREVAAMRRDEIDRRFPEGTAAGRRLQPRRVRRSCQAIQPVQSHRRLRRNARARRLREGQSGAAAGREGGAHDRVRGTARRARSDAARPSPRTLGGRSDGPLHSRPREGEPSPRQPSAKHPAR